jgi:site-specific recombinase XerD
MKNKNIYFLIFSLLYISIVHSNKLKAQNSVLILDLKNKKIEMPCYFINDCIDTLFQQKDTLFIVLDDNRKFYKDSNVICITYREGLIINNLIKIQIKDIDNINFIILRTYDNLCLFKKMKYRKHKYKLISIKEIYDFNNKNFMKIDKNIINIR